MSAMKNIVPAIGPADLMRMGEELKRKEAEVRTKQAALDKCHEDLKLSKSEVLHQKRQADEIWSKVYGHVKRPEGKGKGLKKCKQCGGYK